MQRLPLVHLTVDDTGVSNLPVIKDRLLQSFTQLLAVKIDCDVPAGVNVTTYGDVSLLPGSHCSLYSILETNILSLFIFCYIISFLLLLFNP